LATSRFFPQVIRDFDEAGHFPVVVLGFPAYGWTAGLNALLFIKTLLYSGDDGIFDGKIALRGVAMDDQVKQLILATKTLMDYIHTANVFDKLADAGCGLYDEYRSDKFDELIKNVKNALQPFDKS
jgi:hypothetical protein